MIPAPTPADHERDLAREYAWLPLYADRKPELMAVESICGVYRRAHAAEAEVSRLRDVLRRIHDMAAEDLRRGFVAPCSSIHQIEADARVALGEETTL